jgi:alpha-ketoglutarate-dependent taurine dioxygenase
MIVTITPLPGITFGAEISGVDIRDLGSDVWQQIEAAFREYGILVLPGQQLTEADQVEFARRFGTLELMDEQTLRPDLIGRPLVLNISNVDLVGNHIRDRNHPQTRYLGGNEGWHSDSSFKPVGAKASVLYAIEVPRRGGHTGYADMRASYDMLTAAEARLLAGKSAWHSLEYSQAFAAATDTPVPADPTQLNGAWHPLVAVHPDTGRKSLFIGRHACLIEGMTVTESEQLLRNLLERACQAPRTYHHPWRPGDVVVWDNRCMLHRATEWDLNERRVMRHVRVAGAA